MIQGHYGNAVMNSNYITGSITKKLQCNSDISVPASMQKKPQKNLPIITAFASLTHNARVSRLEHIFWQGSCLFGNQTNLSR